MAGTHAIAGSLRFFFFNDTATTEIYTLSLHDALPISSNGTARRSARIQIRSSLQRWTGARTSGLSVMSRSLLLRSEEHTSELQSQSNLVCRLLLEKKKSLSYAHSHPTTRSLTRLVSGT